MNGFFTSNEFPKSRIRTMNDNEINTNENPSAEKQNSSDEPGDNLPF